MSDFDLLDRVLQIERRLDESDDLRAVKELIYTYHQGGDGGWDGPTHRDPDALTALFTGDAHYQLPGYPHAHGSAQIREVFVALQRNTPWISHYTANPIITVAGDTAKGEIKLIACFWNGDTRLISFGKYFGDFVRTPDGWRFANWEFVRAEQPELRSF